jgi:hypothetical protein
VVIELGQQLGAGASAVGERAADEIRLPAFIRLIRFEL